MLDWLQYILGGLVIAVFGFATNGKVSKDVFDATNEDIDRRLANGDEKFDKVLKQLSAQAVTLGKHGEAIGHTAATVEKIAEKLNVV